jgi:AraC-like DNA-binding protein
MVTQHPEIKCYIFELWVTRHSSMRFDKFIPTDQLKHYIKYFAVSENDVETEYKVFPSSGLVIGFQYSGQLATIKNATEDKLAAAGITGISDTYKIFKNSTKIGTILVYFTEFGFAHFASHPAHELFNLSVSLEDIFDKNSVSEIEEKLTFAHTDKQRIHVVERFLLSKGTIRIKELNERLFISQSPFEKRFRKLVGATPKKFASIVRFNAVLDNLSNTKSLTDICYENNFFDQAHFIKDFKQYTGDTPENFKRFL